MTGPEDDWFLDNILRTGFMELLPDKCRDCPYGRYVLALEVSMEETIGPVEKLKDIQQRCTGYEGPDTTSHLYSANTDRSGCHYLRLLRKESGIDS